MARRNTAVKESPIRKLAPDAAKKREGIKGNLLSEGEGGRKEP